MMFLPFPHATTSHGADRLCLQSAVAAQEKLIAALAAERRQLAQRERLALRRLTVLRMRLDEQGPAKAG